MFGQGTLGSVLCSRKDGRSRQCGCRGGVGPNQSEVWRPTTGGSSLSADRWEVWRVVGEEANFEREPIGGSEEAVASKNIKQDEV